MRVEVIDNAQRFADMGREWTQLLNQSAWKHLFLTHEFLYTWWKHLAASASLRIFCVRRGPNLVASMPLMLTRTRLAKCPVRRLESIGSGWGYGGAIFNQGGTDCLQQLVSAVAATDHWHVFQLSKLHDPPQHLPDRLYEAFPPDRFVHETIRTAVPYISLQMTWEQYLAERSARFRRNIRNRTKRLHRMGRPTFVHVVSGESPPLDQVQIMEYLGTIAGRSWKAKAGKAINSEPKIFRYYSELVQKLYETGALDVCILFVDKRPAAYVLGAVYNREFVEIDICYDDAFASCSPGKLARNHVLECYGNRGLDRYDLIEDYDHKRELTSRFHDIPTYVVYRKKLYPLILRWMKMRFG